MHNVPHWKGSNAGIFVDLDILDLFLNTILWDFLLTLRGNNNYLCHS